MTDDPNDGILVLGTDQFVEARRIQAEGDITCAKSAYVLGQIDIEEFERRIERWLTREQNEGSE